MRNIENIYTDYNGLVDEITEEAIKNRIKQFQAEMQAFIDSNKLQDKVFIHQMALNHAVMDYYSDIQRLKSYQEIGHINEVKIKAYETFWLLKRRPLQLKAQLEDDKWLYINEKFLLARIASFILRDNINIPLTKEKKEAFTNFSNNWSCLIVSDPCSLNITGNFRKREARKKEFHPIFVSAPNPFGLAADLY